MAGLKGQTRLPHNPDPRGRRNAAGLSSSAEFLFSGALVLVNGVVTLNLGAIPALDQTGGLVTLLKASGGITKDANGLYLNRTINTTAPITGGGDLSADRTFAIAAATNSVAGYLTAADHTTFAAKADYSFGANVFSGSGSVTCGALTANGNVVLGSVSTDLTNFVGGSGATAPSTTLLTVPLTIDVYGGTSNLVGTPTAWLDVKVGGTPYKIPLF